ncbi:tetratricopeptide repeat protein (plasmid) [Methylomarinum sp. Ch1-1]|uniref:Tetratricopeptide repeat protein n=1 Tax=Methylomarinum roseum TaxID=3067653 RepID=A0AAU7P0U9_9GAMM|nr:tetratricopeptide repeat protein [Methylomarinum sp. Ch1-1]MDP4518987.1 tetratricopeptide repeat protein [Methylomarinum sp. Ch1-1]MDP4523385.1 tetratricopeptide repeat protein [Methylomarinum sp. Ch1-1]
MKNCIITTLISILISNNALAINNNPILACDNLASDPFDSERKAKGIKSDDININRALEACRQELSLYPYISRLQYQYGRVLNKNKQFKQAAQWYYKAAKQGYTPAQFHLSLMTDVDIPFDYSNSDEQTRNAAKNGYAPAQYLLGMMYQFGMTPAFNAPKDYNKAASWYYKAAMQGHAMAQYNLGYLFDNGQGVPQDNKKAVSWYKYAANNGNADAMHRIGKIYSKANKYSEAANWFLSGANEGHRDSQFEIGAMYLEGRGVPGSFDKAHEWLLKAAKQNQPDAQSALGEMYNNGWGVRKDPKVAAIWWTASVKQGEPWSQVHLGNAYYHGIGVPKDHKKAELLFQLASKSKNTSVASHAQKNLRVMRKRQYDNNLSSGEILGALAILGLVGLALSGDGGTDSNNSSAGSTYKPPDPYDGWLVPGVCQGMDCIYELD